MIRVLKVKKSDRLMDEVIDRDISKRATERNVEKGSVGELQGYHLVFAFSVGHNANDNRTMEPNKLFEVWPMQSILIWKTYFWNNKAPPFSLYFSSALSLAHASMHVCF